ncbi:MAG TPA: S8 family serine peptidase [Candidatus Polarisedimenticolia bacterium]|nr:S8 family serine peptidase [Candidatus Polarisedimenticolia bacterium]
MRSAGRFENGNDGRLTPAVSKIALVVALVLLTGAPALAKQDDPKHKLSPELVLKADGAGSDDLISVIVQTYDDPSDLEMVKLHGRGGRLKAKHEVIRGYSADLPAGALQDLVDDPEVERVSLDVPVRAFLDIAMRAVRADVARQALPGLDGRGVGIALVDTGVALHPDLVRSKNPLKPIEVEIVGREPGFADPFGHGTHVAGILNGNGLESSTPESFRTFRGMAPGARLISIRALQADGTGLTSDVLQAIDWAVKFRRTYNIRVLNLSLGHPVYESYTTDPLCRAAKNAVQAGIVVVTAAGNDGRIGTGFGTIVSPGNEPSVITVGAMDDNDTAAREDDLLAPYSSKGPSLIDYVVKPDLVAPGTFIVSLRAPGSAIDRDHPELALRAEQYESGPDGGRAGEYLSLSGTSLAAPMVAGAAALMIQADPTLRPSDIKARLMASATHGEDLPFATGAGYLDVMAALEATIKASSANSPRAVPLASGEVGVIPIDEPWDGGWQLGLIWGGGRSFGALMDSENPKVTPSGLVWGGRMLLSTDGLVWGGRGLLGADSLVWGGRGLVGADSLVWGGRGQLGAESLVWGGRSLYGGVDALADFGEASLIGTDGSDLVCTGLVWGGL